MASPSELASLLVEHGVAREDSNKQISDKDIDKISLVVSPMEDCLPISAQDAKQDGKSEPDRRAGLLEAWKQMKGSDATYRALIAALLEMERRDAEVIHTAQNDAKYWATALPEMVSVKTARRKGKDIQMYDRNSSRN